MKDGLKPCPFCGGESVSIYTPDPRIHGKEVKDGKCIVCWECDLYFGFDEDYGGRIATEQEAINAWNKRSEGYLHFDKRIPRE